MPGGYGGISSRTRFTGLSESGGQSPSRKVPGSQLEPFILLSEFSTGVTHINMYEYEECSYELT